MGTVSNREMLVARWTEVVNDASLHDVPYKIELNAEGTIEMSPANNWHAAVQAYLAHVLTATHGTVARAAVLAGLHRGPFYKLLQKHALDPEAFRNGTSPT